MDGVVVRLSEVQLLQELLEPFPVLGAVDGIRLGADDLHPGLGQRYGEIERGLAAELDDDAVRLLLLDDVEDILPGQRFEVELVGGVVVGGNRFRIGVDHDGLHPYLLQGEGRMHAAIVELDSLAYPVGAAAEDDDFPAGGLLGLVFLFIGRVIVGGVRLEFRGAGVYQLVHRGEVQLPAVAPDVVLGGSGEVGELDVGKPALLAVPEEILVEALESALDNLLFCFNYLLEIVEEPWVDAG